MARRVLNRRELRAASDAAERMESADAPETDDENEDGDDEGSGKAKSKAKKEKAPKKPRTRTKAAKEVRLKAFWGVFNQSMKRVALFEYSQRAQADQKASEMTASQKTPHFVQSVKEQI